MLHFSGSSKGGWRVAATALAFAGAIALAGCGKKQEAQAVTGQVIAHIGSDDVTQQELENELRLANIAPDKRSDEVVKAALTRILERKYLLQQAIAAKLDREPTVHLDLLRSHEQVLAGAYVERDLRQKVATISNNETDQFIQAHPDRFANRKVFQIEQVSFAPQKDMESLASATKDFKTMDQVEAKLNDLGIKYNRGPAALDSATLPPEMLRPLEARKADDIFFIRSRTSASFFKVTSVEDKPLTPEESDFLAKRDLRNDLAKKNGQETFNAALANAKYEGDYARIMATPTPTPAPAAGEPAAGEAQSGEKPGGEAQSAEKPAGEPEKPETQKDAPKK